MITHLDLFSGIGGFAYALDQVCEAEHIFCDNDKFCQQVLKKHWPNSRIYNDIRTITDTDWNGLQKSGQELETSRDRQLPKVDILTGGFPCQPFSQAGKRKGTDDDRYLWPEMLRAIRLTKPIWVIAENVRGLLTWNEGMVFEQVCLDLEAEGYEIQPLIIPACAKNAPHRRDRIWFVANRRPQHGESGNKQGMETDQTIGPACATDLERQDKDASDTENSGLEGQWLQDRNRTAKPIHCGGSDGEPEWDKNWLEVATELCRMDDGVSERLDFAGWTKAGHRNQRLKALGNAIVPQVAIEIFKAILKTN